MNGRTQSIEQRARMEAARRYDLELARGMVPFPAAVTLADEGWHERGFHAGYRAASEHQLAERVYDIAQEFEQTPEHALSAIIEITEPFVRDREGL